MKKKRWVISVGCGPNQAPLISAAKNYGYSVIGIDRSPATDLVDIAIPISTYSKRDVIAELGEAGKYPQFEGVLCRSSGPAVETAFAIAEKYSLHSAGQAVVEGSISKWHLFSWANRNAIPTIPTLRCKELVRVPDGWDGVVVKPAEPVYGKKNVFLVREPDQIAPAVDKARKESLDGHSIVQPFVLGEDVGLVTLSREGKILWGAFYHEHTSFEGGAVSGLGVASLRAEFDDQVKKRIYQSAEVMLNQSNSSGFVFFSYRCNNSGSPMLYEVNPGLCGDELADKLLPAMWPGVDFFTMDVAAMTGRSLELPVGSPLAAKVVNGNVCVG